MSFPSYHRNARLEQRVRALLSQLRLLSEAESTSVVHFNKSAAKASSKAPKGAFRGRGPDPDEGLLVWFLHRLERTRGGPALNALCAEGEVRLAKRLKRQPGREAGAGFVGSRETADERDKRIAEAYEGLDPAEVRAIESERSGHVTEANVRVVRIKAKRIPEDGRVQEPIPDSLKERIEMCQQLRGSDPSLSLSDLAERFHVSKMTVTRWLREGRPNGDERAA